MKTNKQLHTITTGRQSDEQVKAIISQIHPYVDAIHIREKQKTAAELYNLITTLLSLDIPKEKLILNDRVDVAFALKLGGVQLAYHSLPVQIVKSSFPDLQIGCSIHSTEEAVQARQAGADFLLYGHIFQTNSKPDLEPRGLSDIKGIKESAQLPLIAIGGITLDNAASVLQAGADGFAVMSGIFESKDPLESAKAYARILT